MSVLGGYTGLRHGVVRPFERLRPRTTAAVIVMVVAFSTVFEPAPSVNDQLEKSIARQELEQFLSNHPFDIEQEHLRAADLGHPGEAAESEFATEGEEEEARGENPEARMMQEYLLMIDPATKTLPVERLHVANRIATQHKRLRKGNALSWTERGPNNVGGRTRAIMFDPNDPTNRKVWAGGVSGGLWVTNDITDGNAPWSNVGDFWANIAISSIAYDPTNTNTFYVGTGEGWFNIGSQRGAGIFKSTDGGVTWTQLSSTTGEAFHHVQDLVVTGAGTVLATTRENGVLRRSTDGGQTWTKVLSGQRGTDLEIASNGTIYAAQGMFTTGKIWRSSDDGVTWTQLNNDTNGIPSAGLNRIELAVAPSNPNRVYAVAVSPDHKVSNMYRSFDGGDTWESMPLPVDCDGGIPSDDIGRGQGWYNLILAVSPDDADEVILGSIDLFRTTSGGRSTKWTQMSIWSVCAGTSSVHADHHVVVYRPGSLNQAVFGHDGGVSYSSDVSQAPVPFVNRNRNYNVTQFYSVALSDGVGSNVMVGGTQDNGTSKLSQSGLSAEDVDVTGGDGGYAHIAKNGSQVGVASTQFLKWFRSLDGGNTFGYVGAMSGGGSFINPSDLDDDTDHLFFNYSDQSVGRLNNLDANPVTWDLFGPSGGLGSKVSHVRNSEYAPSGKSTVFFGTRNGLIWRVEDAQQGGSPSWSQVNTTPLPAAAVSSIELAGSEDRMVVTFSNYGVPSVWLTENGGSSWINLDDGRGLPDMPVWWVMADPANTDQLYMGTEAGLWRLPSILSGASWVAEPDIPTTRVAMLDYRPSDGQLAAATHGRGIWTTTLTSQVTPQLALTALLEGPYSGSGEMQTSPTFSNSVPTQQPYGSEDGPNSPQESVDEMPQDVIDWVLVSLRSGTAPGTEIAGSATAALLKKDGSITAADGTLIQFEGLAAGSYYVVIEHRNHVSVMSSQPVDLSGGFGSWDFTAGQDRAYGSGNLRMANLVDGKTGLFAGDATSDGQVASGDFNKFLSETKSAATGYVSGDFNLDGQVTATDFNMYMWNSKAAATSYVP